MIAENDRKSLIKYRLNQAFETIELVQFLISSGKFLVAMNRIYYGMYYSLTALALLNRYETSKHNQLIGWFNKKFISSGIIEARYGKIIRNAHQKRQKGDYDAFT